MQSIIDSPFVNISLKWIFSITCILLIGVSDISAHSKRDNPDLQIFFPRGFGIAVNQVGYMQGSSLDHKDGPWRAGIRRNFDVRDYKPFAEIGKEAGIRFMSLFALAEMDRLNIVATLPHATQAGHDFDNHENIGPEQLEIMQFVHKESAYIELGVTGVGHEWWEDGKKIRSEWYDVENNRPRDEAMMRNHLDVIKNILGQYGFSEMNGHSFPESFSAYGYYWNPGGEYSTGGLFAEYGSKYASTRFELIPELDPPDEFHGGIDNGVLILDRGIFGNLWHNYADLPDDPIETVESDIIDSHWANWLAYDDFLQPELNERYVEYFRGIQEYPYRYLAKNSEQLYSQWLYKENTEVEFTGQGIAGIDNTGMPDEVYDNSLLGNMVLSIPLNDGQHISDARINGEPVAAIFEEAGFGFIYLPPLQQEIYEMTWETGNNPMSYSINNTGTYNVYSTGEENGQKTFKIRMYGTQDVRFRVPDNYLVESNHARLKVLEQRYDTENGELVVTMNGHDIQGETGVVRLVVQ